MLKIKLGTRKNSIVLGGKGSCNRKVKLEIQSIPLALTISKDLNIALKKQQPKKKSYPRNGFEDNQKSRGRVTATEGRVTATGLKARTT